MEYIILEQLNWGINKRLHHWVISKGEGKR